MVTRGHRPAEHAHRPIKFGRALGNRQARSRGASDAPESGVAAGQRVKSLSLDGSTPFVRRDGPPPAQHRAGGLAGGLLGGSEALQAEHQVCLELIGEGRLGLDQPFDNRERRFVGRPSLSRLAGQPEGVADLETGIRQINQEPGDGGVCVGQPLLDRPRRL